MAGYTDDAKLRNAILSRREAVEALAEAMLDQEATGREAILGAVARARTEAKRVEHKRVPHQDAVTGKVNV